MFIIPTIVRIAIWKNHFWKKVTKIDALVKGLRPMARRPEYSIQVQLAVRCSIKGTARQGSLFHAR
ncbi:hypothetical protein D1AOALGA4SA_1835 [Olavius algarvensis Delta 1 endosymbiont]|nr:hypothetical protein D1AOALGA4SA_1835 [Olavius algarvensis Delta 1 endosymbiont]